MRFKSDSDKWLAINALRAAADSYAGDAKLFSNPLGQPEDRALAEQFERQAKDARRIANEIEQEG